MKKMISLLLSLLLCVTLASTVFADPVITVPELPLTDTAVTYTAMICQHDLDTTSPNEKELYVKRVEETGVNIDWTTVPSTSKAERVATTFASGELPDLFVNMLGNNEVMTYGMAGALLPVSDYLEYMPNFSAILESNPAVKSAVTMPDGKIYGLPQINMWSVWPGNGVYERSTAFINKEWLEKLNLEVPTTTEELVEVLRAFKTQDPNGNGATDEIPLSFIYNGWSEEPYAFLYGPFGIIGLAYDMNVQNGKCFYAIQDERYIDAVKFINSLWSEGLIDSEVFTQDAKRYYAKGMGETDVYGVFIDWAGQSVVGSEKANGPDGVVNTGDETYIPLTPLIGPKGDQLWSNEPSGINTNNLCIASTVKNPELICRWVDYLFTPDQSIQELFGAFDKYNTKREDGGWTRIAAPNDVNADEWLLESTTRKLPTYISDEMVAKYDTLFPDGTVGSKKDENKCRLATVYAPYAVKEFYPSVVLSSEANERIAVLWTPIKNAMIEKEVAWCTGESNVETEWADFNKELDSMGLQEIVQIYQEAMDAVK